MKASEIKQWFGQKIDALKEEKVLRDDSNYIFDLLHEDIIGWSIESGVDVLDLIGFIFDYGSAFGSYLWDSADLNKLQSMIDEDEVNYDWWNKTFADEEWGEQKAECYYIDAITHYMSEFFRSEWKKDFGTDLYVEYICVE